MQTAAKKVAKHFRLDETLIKNAQKILGALLRRTEGDEVVVSRPNGTAAFVVTSIRY